ncbi:MAG: T9SS type A sorting domain-containing protein [Lishizhenia sp.]
MKKATLRIILFFPLMVMSQTGPGGVGTNDGSSSLEFWYIADGEAYSNGDLVHSITDRSGNNRTITATGTERPTFVAMTAGANNFSSLVFNIDDELETTYQGNSNENMSFGVMLSYNSDAAFNVILQHGGRNTFAITGSHYYSNFVGGAAHSSTTTASSIWTYHSKTFANSGINRLKFYVNNANTDNFTHPIENRTSNTWIGGNGNGGGTGLNGSIAEIYKFSRVLNTAEQIIIANYLGAKYGITLSASDVYNEDDSGNGNYDYDVAGIGRIDASNMHDHSRGTGIVEILNPSDLGDNEFLFWGHDNGLLSAIETSDTPIGIDARFKRVWRVSERNESNTLDVDVGAVDMRWDLTGLGGINASDLRLLIDTDDDGVFIDETPLSGATDLGNNIFQFSNVSGGINGISNNRRFTLGTANSSQTPLPIELISFTAKPINNSYVQLNWETASEYNNDYFTIERSRNGIEWEEIEVINSLGNSHTLSTYSVFDKAPLQGISYYRLKQTDFNGQFEYSEIKNVNMERFDNSEIVIYPNPINNQVTVIANANELNELAIYDTFGKNATLLARKIEKHNNKLILDVSNLSSGIYYIKTKTSTHKVNKL